MHNLYGRSSLPQPQQPQQQQPSQGYYGNSTTAAAAAANGRGSNSSGSGGSGRTGGGIGGSGRITATTTAFPSILTAASPTTSGSPSSSSSPSVGSPSFIANRIRNRNPQLDTQMQCKKQVDAQRFAEPLLKPSAGQPAGQNLYVSNDETQKQEQQEQQQNTLKKHSGNRLIAGQQVHTPQTSPTTICNSGGNSSSSSNNNSSNNNNNFNTGSSSSISISSKTHKSTPSPPQSPSSSLLSAALTQAQSPGNGKNISINNNTNERQQQQQISSNKNVGLPLLGSRHASLPSLPLGALTASAGGASSSSSSSQQRRVASQPHMKSSPLRAPPTGPRKYSSSSSTRTRTTSAASGAARQQRLTVNDRKLEQWRKQPKNLSPAQHLNVPSMLPAPLPAHKGRMLLALDIDETLVHASFTPAKPYNAKVTIDVDGETGDIFVAYRPHMHTFLNVVSSLFEVTIFTASQSCYADQLMDMIDPQRRLGRQRLFREHCVDVNGARVKDLSLLGRPLERSFIIDNSPVAYLFQPRNAIPIPSWFDDPRDTELVKLVPLLRRLAEAETVYDVLDEHNCSE